MSEKTTIAENLRSARIKAGFKTQESAAEAMGVAQSYISRVETGETVPLIETMRRFAEVYGVPLASLLEPLSLIA